MRTVETINFIIICLFFLCYSYQFFYIPVSWLKKFKPHGPAKASRLAVLIAARNEQAVIGNLLDSLAVQDYTGVLDVFVVADNCTDATAAIARSHGAHVFERSDTVHTGKGYALNSLLGQLCGGDHPAYDAFVVLDADNIVSPNFITEINRTYSDGYEIVTCYRNSKNYGDNWISAGYALWFLREARYLNASRMLLGSSCAVSGTGFLFSRAVLDACGGWNFFLLTEDIEFTIHNVVGGVKVGYCPTAVLYDEQPVSFRQSLRQRLRWARGYLQVFARYGGRLVSGMFRGSFSCYDMAMNIMPAAILTGVSAVVNIAAAVISFTGGGSAAALGLSLLQTLVSLYLTMFVIGGITTVTEWRHIHCSAPKKVLYIFTFPIFMFTYIPLCAAALFKNPQWKPIRHSRSLTLDQIRTGA
ncbi:MAG: glycosyltransferase family 2 protein [Oscillospiraceae bacterium]|nr:glycosyltransferase family 2 protein [Oscillospiraceae bacterium]